MIPTFDPFLVIIKGNTGESHSWIDCIPKCNFVMSFIFICHSVIVVCFSVDMIYKCMQCGNVILCLEMNDNTYETETGFKEEGRYEKPRGISLI